jgi:hypothetical protein
MAVERLIVKLTCKVRKLNCNAIVGFEITVEAERVGTELKYINWHAIGTAAQLALLLDG